MKDAYILGIMAGAIIISLVFFFSRYACKKIEKDEERAREENAAQGRVYYQGFRCLNCDSASSVYIPKGVYKEDVGPFPCHNCGCLQRFNKSKVPMSPSEKIRAITLEEEEPQ